MAALPHALKRYVDESLNIKWIRDQRSAELELSYDALLISINESVPQLCGIYDAPANSLSL